MDVQRCSVMLSIFFFLFLVGGCASDEDKKAAHFNRGQEYFAAGEYKSAELEFRNAIQIDPRYGQAHKRLGETYFKLGDARKSYQAYTNALEILPDDTEIILKLASFAFLGKQYDEARAKVEQVLAKAPENIEALYLMAGIHGALQEGEASRDFFGRIITLDPSQTRAYLGLARQFQAAGNMVRAEAQIKKAVAVDPRAMEPRMALFDFYRDQRRDDEAEKELRGLIGDHPGRTELYLMLGQFYMVRGKPDLAETTYQQVIAVTPEKSAPYMALAELYKSQNRSEDVLQTYEQALEYDPENVGIMNQIARHHFSGGNQVRAEEMIARILEKRPDFPPTILLQGELALARRDFAKALEYFDQVVRDAPKSPQAHYFRGLTHLGQGAVQLAKTDLQRAAELNSGYFQPHLVLADIHYRNRDYDLARKACEKVLEINPGNYRAQLILGNTHLQEKELAQARALFEGLITKFPENPGAFYRLGLVERLEGNREAALSRFNQALAINPRLMDVFSQVISLYAAAGDYDTALAQCDAQLQTVAGNPAATAVTRALKGRLHEARDEFVRAEAEYQAALAAEETYIAPYYALARLYVRNQQVDKAVDQYQALIAKSPDQVAPHMLLGALYDMQKETDSAEKHYRAALNARPDFAPAANNLAYLLVNNDRSLDEALALARQAKERLPEDPNVMDTLGLIYLKKGLLDSAISELEECRMLLAENPMVRYHLGLAYHKAGEGAKAKSELSAALEMDGDFEGAEHARQLISEL